MKMGFDNQLPLWETDLRKLYLLAVSDLLFVSFDQGYFCIRLLQELR